MKRLLLSLLLAHVFYAGAAGQTTAVKLEGQVVCCEDCWAKADRKTTPYGTRADLEAAVECVTSGEPSFLVVADDQGGFTFHELQLGRFKREGKNWLAYIGKRVEVTGTQGKKKNRPYIKVDALTVLAEPVAATEPEVNFIGRSEELALKDLFGVEQRLASYRGRVVVLNFWATYCVPCRKEMPDLAAIQNEYAALGVQVIGAAADTIADQQKVRQFIKETKLNFPVWLGASAEDMQRFGLGSALPGTVVIGRDGKIVAAFKGVIKVAELKKQLDSLLAAAERESRAQVATAKGEASGKGASRNEAGKAASVPS